MLSSWKSKSLSIGGRLTLIKSILRSLPIYYLSLFLAPKNVISILESIRCRFFWGFCESQKGICWVKWNNILLDHSLGGLGVGSIFAKNLDLLRKWKWRFLTEKGALWRMVIKDFYGDDGGFSSSAAAHGSNGVWVDVIKAVAIIDDIVPSFRSSFVLKNSNGSSVSFWKDAWCNNGSRLMDLYPRLYALETNKECKVNDLWCLCNGVWGGVWSWRIPLRGRTVDDLVQMVDIISNVSFSSDSVDKWVWNSDVSGMFKVKVLSHNIQNSAYSDYTIGKHDVWNSWIPRKVNVCVWRASLNRLATRLKK
ncbi:hypothetical protein Tco_1083250 [Tanacetum coccineum]